MQANNLETNTLQQAYELAYQKACKELQCRDPLNMAVSSGTIYDQNVGAFFLRYLADEYKVTFPCGQVSYTKKDEVVPNTVKVVLLHYLLRAGGQPLKNDWISFKEIRDGGMIYAEPFNKR